MITISRAVLVLLPTFVPASLRGVGRRTGMPAENRTRACSRMGFQADAPENSWCPRIRWP